MNSSGLNNKVLCPISFFTSNTVLRNITSLWRIHNLEKRVHKQSAKRHDKPALFNLMLEMFVLALTTNFGGVAFTSRSLIVACMAEIPDGFGSF
jgi:hypothetical protein